MTDKNRKKSATDAAELLGINNKHTRKKRWRRWLFILILLAGGGSLSAFYQRDEGVKTYRYKTAEATKGDLAIIVTATGTLEPVNQVMVGSELSGTIAKVEVDFNQRVVRNQPLARLDTDQMKNRVAQVRAALNLSRARLQEETVNLQEAKRNLKRCKELAARDLCPEQQMETVQSQYHRSVAKHRGAKAQVSQAKANLASNETDLKKSVIRSPIDGIVLLRDIEPGQTVAASFQTPVLFHLAEDLSQMELHIDVDEADVGRVQTGQRATFTVDAYPGRRFPAQITSVRYAPQRLDGVVTYRAVLRVDNSELLLRPGMTATADNVTKRVQGALLVPNSTLRFKPSAPTARKRGGSMLAASMPWHRRRAPKKRNPSAQMNQSGKGKVWILQNNQPVARPVITGATDGRMTEILKGDLEPGAVLLVDRLGPTR